MACVCSNRALPCLVPDIPRRTIPYDELLTIDTSLEYEIEPSKFPGSAGRRGPAGCSDASERILQIGTRSAPTPDCTITHVSPGPLPPLVPPTSTYNNNNNSSSSGSLNESDEVLTQLIDELQADLDGGLLDVDDLLRSPSSTQQQRLPQQQPQQVPSQYIEPNQRVPGSCGDLTRVAHTVSPRDQQPLGEYLDELRPIDNSPLLYGPNWNCLPPGQFTAQQQKHIEAQKLVESLKQMEVQKHLAAQKHMESQKLLEAQSQLKAQQRLLEAHQKRMDAQHIQQRIRYPVVSTSQNAVPQFVDTSYAPPYRTMTQARSTMCPPVSTTSTSFLPVISNNQIMRQQQQQQQQQQQRITARQNTHFAPVNVRPRNLPRYPMQAKSTMAKYHASKAAAACEVTAAVAPNVTIHHPAFRNSGYCHVTPAATGNGDVASGNMDGHQVGQVHRAPVTTAYNARALQAKKRPASLMDNIESSNMLDSIYMTYAQMNNSTKRVKTDVFTSTSPFQCYIRC